MCRLRNQMGRHGSAEPCRLLVKSFLITPEDSGWHQTRMDRVSFSMHLIASSSLIFTGGSRVLHLFMEETYSLHAIFIEHRGMYRLQMFFIRTCTAFMRFSLRVPAEK